MMGQPCGCKAVFPIVVEQLIHQFMIFICVARDTIEHNPGKGHLYHTSTPFAGDVITNGVSMLHPIQRKENFTN